MPLCMEGVGLRSEYHTARAARWASWADGLSMSALEPSHDGVVCAGRGVCVGGGGGWRCEVRIEVGCGRGV